MQRRLFLTTTAAAAAAAATAMAPQLSFAATPIDAAAEIKQLRIASGPFTGAYLIAPAGRINWYFTNLGLIPLVSRLTVPELSTYILPYLNLYLSRLEGNAIIRDVDLPAGPLGSSTLVLSDSDDSYAATYLSLVARYLRASGNWSWWKTNKTRLNDIAYFNLAVAAKSTGLTSVFQAPRSSTNSVGYLMDNCEAYRGLRDFAATLRLQGETGDANYYDSFATAIGVAISRDLWAPAQSAFRPSDADLVPTTSFYPGASCQVFPQAFGVKEAAAHFDPAWAYLNKTAPNWQLGRLDPFPWSVLGFVAAQRGQLVQARAQLSMIDDVFVANRGLVTINELGFYLRASNLMLGRADI